MPQPFIATSAGHHWLTFGTQALANSRAGIDLSPGNNDIVAQFNSRIGTTCAFPLVWYYGLNANPPSGALDFVSVVLHELGHGLGFQSFVTLQSGVKLAGLDDAFSLKLEDHSTGKLFPQMTNAARVAASLNSGNLHWVGANVVASSGASDSPSTSQPLTFKCMLTIPSSPARRFLILTLPLARTN